MLPCFVYQVNSPNCSSTYITFAGSSMYYSIHEMNYHSNFVTP